MASPFDFLKNVASNVAQSFVPPQQKQQTMTGQMPQRQLDGQPVDPFQLIMQQRQNLFENIRSPMVRRTVGGDIIDESAPTGIDWLRNNGGRGQKHSWETDTSRWAPSPQTGPQPQTNAFDVVRGAGGETAGRGQYGAGVFNPQGSNDLANVTQVGMDAGASPTGPFLLNEQAALSGLTQDAYNNALMNPQAPQVQQAATQSAPAPKAAVVNNSPFAQVPASTPMTPPVYPMNNQIMGPPAPAATMPQVGSNNLDLATQSVLKQMGMTSEGQAPGPWQESSPLYQGSNMDKFASAGVRAGDAVQSGNPGFLPFVGRSAALGGATVWDILANLLWDPTRGPQALNATTNWINPTPAPNR